MARHENYQPRFDIGAVVFYRAFGEDHQSTVTARKVRRVTRANERPDTFYTLGDGTTHWEYGLQPTTDKVAPAVALQRIVAGFGTGSRQYPVYPKTYQLHVRHAPETEADQGTVRTEQVSVVLNLTNGHRVEFSAWAYDDLVETIGPWEWAIFYNWNGEKEDQSMIGSDPNLGSAIVATYNAACSQSPALT